MNARTPLALLTLAALLAGCGASAVPKTPSGSTDAGAAHARGKTSYKIYVANFGDHTITTYESSGRQTTPTISTASYLFATAVAPSGNIYALTFDPLSGPNTDGTVSTYRPDGSQTTPTIDIKERGYHAPVAMAVDANGKIYVLSSVHNGTPGRVTTYNPDGTPATPTFRTGADSSGIAVDAHGKIYVTNATSSNRRGSVTTYQPDGTPSAPTITRGVHRPVAVTVAGDGTIFVANTNDRGHDGTTAGYVTSYRADGSGPLRTIRYREQAPSGLAEASGNVYVTSDSAYRSSLKTHTLNGRRVSPTIVDGLDEPAAVAIH